MADIAKTCEKCEKATLFFIDGHSFCRAHRDKYLRDKEQKPVEVAEENDQVAEPEITEPVVPKPKAQKKRKVKRNKK